MDQLKNKDYYVSSVESKDNITVYVKFMNSRVLSEIPNRFNNKKVLVHYASYNEARKINFQEFDLKNVATRAREYDEKLLTDILYEIHDGEDAITNVKEDNFEIYNLIKTIYDKYGFDVTHDAILN